jgi:hypothetical protein
MRKRTFGFCACTVLIVKLARSRKAARDERKMNAMMGKGVEELKLKIGM